VKKNLINLPLEMMWCGCWQNLKGMQTNYVGEIAGSRTSILVAPYSQADMPAATPTNRAHTC